MNCLIDRRFPIWNLFEWRSEWIEVFLTLSPCSSLCNTFFPFCLSIRLFCYVLFVPIFFCKIVLHHCHCVTGMCWGILLQPIGRIFRCFGMSWFVTIVLSSLDNFLAFLLLPVPSGLFHRSALFCFFLCFFFLFSQNVPAYYSYLIFFLVVEDLKKTHLSLKLWVK